MAYFIEFGQDADEGFYAEFVIINKNTGGLLVGDGIDHQFNIFGWRCDDYGFRGGIRYGQTIASNSNGLITAPEPGVVAVAIPPSAFPSFGGYPGNDPIWGYGCYDRAERNRVVRFKLIAVPLFGSTFDADFNPDYPMSFGGPNYDFAKVLVKGTISFGDRVMPSPRIQLGVYPLYPNAQTATAPVPVVQVAQIKQQLVKLGSYDTVEAALMGPLDPATISWNTGGPVNLGGPLSNLISRVLFNSDPTATGLFLTIAAANSL